MENVEVLFVRKNDCQWQIQRRYAQLGDIVRGYDGRWYELTTVPFDLTEWKCVPIIYVGMWFLRPAGSLLMHRLLPNGPLGIPEIYPRFELPSELSRVRALHWRFVCGV